MKDLVRSAWHWLADTRLARSVLDTLFRSWAHQRVVELDQQVAARSQNRTLLGLVHKARGTRFGREHDFCRIRSLGDFQRLVPLRTPAELWREYWQPAFPNLAGATWPGPIPYLAISAQERTGPLPYIPFSPDLWAAQQTAVLTSLAFVLHARPGARLCSGRFCFLGNGTTLAAPSDARQLESLEAVAVRRLPALLEPFALVGSVTGRGDLGRFGEPHLFELAERSARTAVTCVAGSADRLVRFFAHVKRVTRRACLADVWPQLTAVLFARGPADPDLARLTREIGSPDVLCLEMDSRPEGAVAIDDPRYGRLRLLPDHGVYFEFVPLDQLGKPRPARHTVNEVHVGVPYALAVSSPAGVWACLVGSVVRFERRDPPLLQLVETGALWERTALPSVQPATCLNAAQPFPGRPPHVRPSVPSFGAPGRPLRATPVTR
jgi:hypothetical protein